jgi:inner membrane transporter RhtA
MALLLSAPVLLGEPPPPRWRAALGRSALAAVPPPGLVLLAILSIQLGAALAIQLFATLGPATTTFLRLAFSALILLVATRPPLAEGWRRHAGKLLLFGLVIAAMNLASYQAIARIPLGIAVTIAFIGPLSLAVAASRRRRDLLWVGLAALGVALLSPEIGEALDPLGILFAAGAAAGWAGFILLSKRVGGAIPGGGGLAMGMTVAALVAAPFGLATGGLARLDPAQLALAFAIALLSQALPLSLEFAALQRLSPRLYGILVTLEPAVAALIGAALLAQPIGPRGSMAIAAVTLAALGATLSGEAAGKS